MTTIQTLLEAAVADGAAPGFSAALATPDGERFLQAGARGVADPTPMSADTVFWIASCTKAVVSAAALELVAQGALALDEPVGRLVPELAEAKVLTGFGADGAPALRPAARPITLRSLLTHTSGLAYDFNSAEVLQFMSHHGLSLGAAGCTGLPLVFDPGDDWRYGVGIDVAGLMIEAATGKPLGAALADMVFRPLGMADTTFDPTPEQNARRAGLHIRLPDGGLAPIDPMSPMPPALRGGGGMFSTAPDYLKFLRAILAGGAGVFSPATLAHMRTPQLTGSTIGDLASVIPMMSNDYRPLAGLSKGWTFAFLQNLEGVPGGRGAGSLTWAGLANCYYWADPDAGMAGVLFAQLLPFADPKVLATFEAFEHAAYAAAGAGATSSPPGVSSAPAHA